MAFFKPSSETISNTSVARLEALIWVLIYGGLRGLVLGLSVGRTDEAWGWSLVVGGAVVAGVGFILIYVRSRIKARP